MHNSVVKLFLMGLDMPYTLNNEINKTKTKNPTICTMLIYYYALMIIFKTKRKQGNQKMWTWGNKPLWTMKFLPFSLIPVTTNELPLAMISSNLQLSLSNSGGLIWGLQKEIFKSIPCLSSFNYLWHYLLLFSRNLLLGLSRFQASSSWRQTCISFLTVDLKPRGNKLED